MSNVSLRIGTRKSELALWQANLVKSHLEKIGITSHLVMISSEGDQNQTTPLYEMGVVGVFTRSLDIALLENKIDIAVHSMKDVPVVLPKGIVKYAVLERGSTEDILIRNSNKDTKKCIATSSLRRKAQWLNRHPNYQVAEIRGNVNTRLAKVDESNWEGAIFAKAGLERINLLKAQPEILDWMIPAPAQGAIMIVGRENEDWFSKVGVLNHFDTDLCVSIERHVLHGLEAGCTSPIAVLATQKSDVINVIAGVYSVDGKQKREVDINIDSRVIETISDKVIQQLMMEGGKEIIDHIKSIKV